MLRRPLYLALVVLAFIHPLVWAEEGESGEESRPEWAADGRNELALFVGVTDVAGDVGPSLGLDYEYRFTKLFGLGATAEYTGADLREWLIAVSFNWHVWRELKVFGAPGVEIETEDGSDSFVSGLASSTASTSARSGRPRRR